MKTPPFIVAVRTVTLASNPPAILVLLPFRTSSPKSLCLNSTGSASRMKSLGSGRGWMALLTWWTKGEMCAQVVYGPRYTKASQHFQNHPSIWPELKCSTKGGTSHTWYTFMDLLPFGCSQWKVGQPDNWTKHGLGGGEDCAELAERGKLNDDHCTRQRKYICERAATADWTQSTSEQPVQLVVVMKCLTNIFDFKVYALCLL